MVGSTYMTATYMLLSLATKLPPNLKLTPLVKDTISIQTELTFLHNSSFVFIAVANYIHIS